MPLKPDLPFPKSAGDAIRSKDWNDLVSETQRLDNAKVNRAGDAISGPLTIAGALSVGTTASNAALHVVGSTLLCDGTGYAAANNRMASGSLTIGSITSSFGGGSGWSNNTAGLLLETLNDTEIAIHDSGTRINSVAYYQSSNNSLTIGRDMGWGAISSVRIAGGMHAGNSDLYFTRTDHSHSGFGNTAGFAAVENASDYDALMILGRANAQVPGRPAVPKKRVVRLWDFLEVNGDLAVTDSIRCDRFKVTAVFSTQAGPLPLSATFTSSGGTLILMASGSGFRSTGGQLGMFVRIDSMVMGTAKGFTNEINSHKAFPPIFSVVTSVGAGNHTLDIQRMDANTLTDYNDFFSVTVLELPFR